MNTTTGIKIPQIPAIFVIDVCSSFNCRMILILVFFVYISYLTALILSCNCVILFFDFLKKHKTLFIQSILQIWGNLDRSKDGSFHYWTRFLNKTVFGMRGEPNTLRRKRIQKTPDSPTTIIVLYVYYF